MQKYLGSRETLCLAFLGYLPSPEHFSKTEEKEESVVIYPYLNDTWRMRFSVLPDGTRHGKFSLTKDVSECKGSYRSTAQVSGVFDMGFVDRKVKVSRIFLLSDNMPRKNTYTTTFSKGKILSEKTKIYDQYQDLLERRKIIYGENGRPRYLEQNGERLWIKIHGAFVSFGDNKYEVHDKENSPAYMTSHDINIIYRLLNLGETVHIKAILGLPPIPYFQIFGEDS